MQIRLGELCIITLRMRVMLLNCGQRIIFIVATDQIRIFFTLKYYESAYYINNALEILFKKCFSILRENRIILKISHIFLHESIVKFH